MAGLAGDFRKQLDAWAAASEKSEADYFIRRALCSGPGELVPRERSAIRRCRSSSTSCPIQTCSKPLQRVVCGSENMLDRVRTTNAVSPPKCWKLRALRHPLLGLYAAEERTFGQKRRRGLCSGEAVLLSFSGLSPATLPGLVDPLPEPSGQTAARETLSSPNLSSSGPSR